MMFVYSVLDRKAREFGNLVLAKTEDHVKRALAEGLSGRADSTMALYGQDFDLYHVGDFDEDNGVIVPQNPPRLVGIVGDIVLANMTDRTREMFNNSGPFRPEKR